MSRFPWSRFPWSRRRLVLVVVAVVVIAAAGGLFVHEGRAKSDQWASILGFFLNALAALLAFDAAFAVRRGGIAAVRRTPGERLEDLAAAVSREYAADAALRRLQDPDPLPVRWRYADRDLADHPRNVWREAGSPPDDFAGDSTPIDMFRRVPGRRLVLLGPPGSGKSVAALTLAMDLMAARAPGGPVPLVLALSTWDPRTEGFRAWISRRLAEIDAGLAAPDGDGRTAADQLVARHDILPVLDGLDELPEQVKGGVLDALNAVLGRDDPIVVTCRTPQYRVAVDAGDVLTGAAVVEIEPLRFTDVAEYLPRTTRPGRAGADDRWAPVLRRIHDEPDRPSSRALVAVLGTPLMVWLARVQYSDTRADPAELLDFADEHTLRTFLLDGLVPAAYADPGGHRRPGPPPEAAERWLMRLASELAGRHSYHFRWWEWADALPLRAVRIVVTIVSAVAAAGAAAGVLGVDLGRHRGILAGAAFGAVVGGAVWMVPWLRRPPRPTRFGTTAPLHRLRRAGSVLVIGVIPVGVVAFGGLTTEMASTDNVAGLISVLLTLFAAAAVRPVEAEQAVSPARLLRADRFAATVQGGLIGFATLVLVAAGMSGQRPAPVAVLVSALFGLVTGVTWAVAGSAWGRFLLARVYYRATGRYPLRLMAFLADAHARGVLRQVGATYQFRHETLQTRLATRAR